MVWGFRRPAARVVLLDRNRQIFLVKGSDPMRPEKGTWWEIPGGGIERGESSADAAKRELYEETGIKVKNVQKIFKQTKLSINPQRSKAYPHVFMTKIDNKYIEVLKKYSKKKFSKEIESVNIVKIRDFFKLVKRGNIVSSYMIAIFYMYLLKEKLISLKKIK